MAAPMRWLTEERNGPYFIRVDDKDSIKMHSYSTKDDAMEALLNLSLNGPGLDLFWDRSVPVNQWSEEETHIYAVNQKKEPKGRIVWWMRIPPNQQEMEGVESDSPTQKKRKCTVLKDDIKLKELLLKGVAAKSVAVMNEVLEEIHKYIQETKTVEEKKKRKVDGTTETFIQHKVKSIIPAKYRRVYRVLHFMNNNLIKNQEDPIGFLQKQLSELASELGYYDEEKPKQVKVYLETDENLKGWLNKCEYYCDLKNFICENGKIIPRYRGLSPFLRILSTRLEKDVDSPCTVFADFKRALLYLLGDREQLEESAF